MGREFGCSGIEIRASQLRDSFTSYITKAWNIIISNYLSISLVVCLNSRYIRQVSCERVTPIRREHQGHLRAGAGVGGGRRNWVSTDPGQPRAVSCPSIKDLLGISWLTKLEKGYKWLAAGIPGP